MSLFSNPIPNDTNFFNAIVLGVDNTRKICKIKTSFKQSFDNVPWICHPSPEFNDLVFVTVASGNAIILGILPRIGDPKGFTPDLDDAVEIDTGNYGPLSGGLVGDPGKPVDIVSGDQILSNKMGGIFGLLKGGSFIARASRLSEILLSKYDDLVRIVGRSFELFTDLSIDVYASVRGRAYRYAGYGETLSAGRSGNYKYEELYGDTVLASSLKGDYYGLTPSTFASLPAANTIIRKYKIVDGANLYYYQDLYYNDGRLYTKVQNAAATSYTEVNQTNATFDAKTDNGTSYTRFQTTPTAVTLTYNGTNVGTVLIDGTNLKLTYTVGGNSHTVVIDSTKLELTYVSGVTNKVTLASTMVQLAYNSGAHFVTVDAAGVHMA